MEDEHAYIEIKEPHISNARESKIELQEVRILHFKLETRTSNRCWLDLVTGEHRKMLQRDSQSRRIACRWQERSSEIVLPFAAEAIFCIPQELYQAKPGMALLAALWIALLMSRSHAPIPSNWTWLVKACLHWASMIDLEHQHQHQHLHLIWSIGVETYFWSDSLGLLRNLSNLIGAISLATL